MTQEFFLYSKTDCPLCDEFKTRLDESGVKYHIVQIENDLELMQRYGARVPVLVSGNSVICEGHFDNQAIRTVSFI